MDSDLQAVAGLSQAAAAARAVRAEWLSALATGMVTVDDVLSMAGGAVPQLRRVLLRRLLADMPQVGPRRSGEAVALLRRLAGVPATVPDRCLTVAWLLDRRVAGRRMSAFREAVAASGREAPARFPWS